MTVPLKVSVSEEQKLAIERNAAARGLSVSAFLRSLGLEAGAGRLVEAEPAYVAVPEDLPPGRPKAMGVISNGLSAGENAAIAARRESELPAPIPGQTTVEEQLGDA